LLVERIFNRIGFLLIAVAFAIALIRSISITIQPAKEEQLTLRMAHWRLEKPVREAFDAIAREYAKIRPGFELQQVVVPDRIWRYWMRTQLVGETPPDIMNVGWVMTTDLLSRYFIPLTDYIDQPNPYNEGTDLEGVSWRNTFHDGLDGGPTYNPDLMEYFGVNFTHGTFRLLYNKALLEEIAGVREIDSLNLEEFLAIAEEVREFAQKEGRWIAPVSGMGTRTVALFSRLFGSQTQRLAQNLRLRPDFNPANSLEVLAGALEGKWDLQHPAIEGGFYLLEQFGKQHNLGFLGMSQDDAAHLFLQKKALFSPGAIFNTSYIRELADFEVGVLPSLPFISPNHPRYGENTFGPNAEGVSETALPMGITRASENFDLALDFLRFATTRASSERFGFISGNLPTVVGADIDPKYEAFKPNIDGAYPSGFDLHTPGTPDVSLIVRAQFHDLVHPSRGLEAFMEGVRPHFRSSIESDFKRHRENLHQSILRNDVLAMGFLRAEGDAADGKGARLLHGQNVRQDEFLKFLGKLGDGERR